MELDPVFIKALRLLHSRSKDSMFQLRSLYEEALKAKRSGSRVMSLPSSPISAAAKGSSRREVEKRNFDKLKRDLSELVPSAASKRPRLSSPGWNSSSKSHTPSPTPPGSRGDPSGGNSSCGEDPGIGDLEMNLDNLTCVICKSLNQENGNILMECHNCQNLYHQECHSPAVSNEVADDPRRIWHCSQCAKTLKRASPGLKGGSSSNIKGSGGRPSPSKVDNPSSGSLFKRMHETPKGMSSNGKSVGGSSGSSSSGGSSGLANVSSFKPSSSLKSSSSSSGTNRLNSKATQPGSSSSSSHNGGSSSSNIISADKRLQMMKKKAAASRKK